MNSSLKHTPGKWKANRYGFVHSGKTLISCPPTQTESAAGLCSHPQSEECKANALLIASAPDLLEQLRYLYASISQVPGTDKFSCIASKDRLAGIYNLLYKPGGPDKPGELADLGEDVAAGRITEKESLSLALPAVEYMHEHEGCPETLKAVKDALARAEYAEQGALLAIQEIMDGVEWSPDTLDEIAQVMIRAGYKIGDMKEGQ